MKRTDLIFAGILITGALLVGAAAQAQPYGQPYQPYPPYQPDPYYGQPYDPYGPGYGRGGRGYGGPEAIYAVEAGRDNVRVRVSSNGCTRRQDFQARSSGSRNNPSIAFIRVRPDNCRALAPGGVWLSFSYRELGIARGDAFTLVNPLTPWIGPGA